MGGLEADTITGALAMTDAIFIYRFYTGGYGDDTGNLINRRLTLEQCCPFMHKQGACAAG
ncbi:hypothetical protein [Desulfitobacterium dichloroeliminans]|uniref:hypothetical protein n=1 Tax=Desulfitobacterium dichloroeliminans TaxID=233055 RepID=UPI000300DDD3|nr:hypothetical protein [Desulfitobacterium dichloroeliminans]